MFFYYFKIETILKKTLHAKNYTSLAVNFLHSYLMSAVPLVKMLKAALLARECFGHVFYYLEIEPILEKCYMLKN